MMKYIVVALCCIILFAVNVEGNAQASNDRLVTERIDQSNRQFSNFANVKDIEANETEDMAVWNPFSASPSSGCLGSACGLSGCLGSGCIISACAGSGCEASACGGSACMVSGCGGSVCGASICGGSVCAGSACNGSVCAKCN